MITLSSLSLVLVNAIPVVGVLFLGWNVAAIMILYWSENLVVGFFNIIKMARARGSDRASSQIRVSDPQRGRGYIIVFFMFHYGLFTMGHGVFVFSMFGKPDSDPFALIFTLLFLFTSHYISYQKNFMDNGEYLKVSYNRLFLQPYGRVVVMHLTIIGAGFFIQSQGGAKPAILILVGLKTVIDLISHRIEHRKLQRM